MLVGLRITWFSEKNTYYQCMHTCFDAQLDQIILNGIYRTYVCTYIRYTKTNKFCDEKKELIEKY
jgi:hypothetical protein